MTSTSTRHATTTTTTTTTRSVAYNVTTPGDDVYGDALLASEPLQWLAWVQQGLQHRPTIAQGRYSIDVFSIYLCVTAGMFIVAALMHPGELISLLFGLAYLLALPSGCKCPLSPPVFYCPDGYFDARFISNYIRLLQPGRSLMVSDSSTPPC